MSRISAPLRGPSPVADVCAHGSGQKSRWNRWAPPETGQPNRAPNFRNVPDDGHIRRSTDTETFSTRRVMRNGRRCFGLLMETCRSSSFLLVGETFNPSSVRHSILLSSHTAVVVVSNRPPSASKTRDVSKSFPLADGKQYTETAHRSSSDGAIAAFLPCPRPAFAATHGPVRYLSHDHNH